MIITLCGSARFEAEFHRWNEVLTLAGHVVFSLAVYPSSKAGVKTWYTDEQKEILDRVHKMKIGASDAIFVIDIGGYAGDSTRSEIEFAAYAAKMVFFASDWDVTGKARLTSW
jgi:hypothetical protein